MAGNLYQTFDLCMASALEMPMLRPGPVGARADIRVVSAAVPDALAEVEVERGRVHINARQILIRHAHFGSMLIEDGENLTIQPKTGNSPATTRTFVLGTGMGAIFHQRHRLMLHGSAMTNGRHTILVLGRSGAGKSTTARAFMAQGWRLLADDQCALSMDGGVDVLPAYPSTKLWRDALERLGLEGSWPRVEADIDKYVVPVGDQFCETAMPVDGIFVLVTDAPGSGAEVQVESLQPGARVAALRAQVYRRKFLHGPSDVANLRNCAHLAAAVPVHLVHRSPEGNSLAQVVAAIESRGLARSGLGPKTPVETAPARMGLGLSGG